MGLENLSNPFNDISLNTKERVDSSNSPVSDKLDDGSDFGRYSKTPISDSVFVNQTNRLKSGQSLFAEQIINFPFLFNKVKHFFKNDLISLI